MSIALPVYLLCAFTSGLVAVLLYLNFRRTKVRFLLWSALCFACLTLNNALLFLDMVVLGEEIDLSIVRTIPAVVGVSVLLYGFIWDVP
ncbi:MAG: DUF5985 family protein [Bdellovibrionota bacterium]